MINAFLDEESQRYEDEGLFARDIDGQLIRTEPARREEYESKILRLEIDGQPVEDRYGQPICKAVPARDSQGNILRDQDGLTTPRATTIYDAAHLLFVNKLNQPNPIPVLCHRQHMQPAAVCRICVVEIYSKSKKRRERKLLPACQHPVDNDMEVHTIESPDPAARQRVRSAVKVLLELLLADHFDPTRPNDQAAYNELWALAQRLQIPSSRFSPSPLPSSLRPRIDNSSPVIAVNHGACILCDRCVRACDEVKKNFIIGRTGKGYTTHIGFDLNADMGQSECVRCGECMISCPTSALTFKEAVKVSPSKDATSPVFPVSADELKMDPLFQGVPYKFLQWNSGAVVRRSVKKGEVLCREGDYGSTAFILKQGRFEVSIRTPLTHVCRDESKSTRWSRFLGRLFTTWKSDQQNPREGGEEAPAVIRNDGNAPLPFGQPVAYRTPEDIILGEMTCMSNYPRSATVVADEDGEILEIGRNVLYMLQRHPTSREMLNKCYRDRALGTHLMHLPIFEGLDKSAIEFLRVGAEFVQVDPGQVIFRQGQEADHFYLIRIGFVKVSQMFLGQERVLDYLGPGAHFGEIGLLSALSDLVGQEIPQGVRRGVRTATCTALDHVELVRIKGEDFRALLDRHPSFCNTIIQVARDLLTKNESTRQSLGRPLGDFLKQGLQNAQSLLVLDLERCTRCDECVRACAEAHGGNSRVIREGLRFDNYLVTTSCRSCMDPLCMIGCPVNAIHRNKSLEIRIEDHCIGCELCYRNCPYGNITMQTSREEDDPEQPGRKRPVVKKATTCDLCQDFLGPGEVPSCVYACPHDAAFRWSGQQLLTKVEGKAHS